MVYKDGFGNPLSKGGQILMGVGEGTAAVHVVPLGAPLLLSKLRDKETSPLEKIAATLTAAVEGAAYYVMIRRGIPAHYLLGITNVFGTYVVASRLIENLGGPLSR